MYFLMRLLFFIFFIVFGKRNNKRILYTVDFTFDKQHYFDEKKEQEETGR